MDARTLASMIDQTLLKPTVGYGEAREWMLEQRDRGFATLCVSPFLVPMAAELLDGTSTKVCTVAGFPLGYALTRSKAEEARALVDAGAVEIDMVVNVAQLLAGDIAYVHDDIASVVSAVREESDGRGIVKVILETGHLTPELIETGSRLAVEAGAAFVKTSTGFGPRGASVEDVEVMRRTVGREAGVKAAGGIRDLPDALSMIEAGADRIGTSSGAGIVSALLEADRSGSTVD